MNNKEEFKQHIATMIDTMEKNDIDEMYNQISDTIYNANHFNLLAVGECADLQKKLIYKRKSLIK